eukprot:191978-Pleurochrysis_carterae.AAC.1
MWRYSLWSIAKSPFGGQRLVFRKQFLSLALHGVRFCPLPRPSSPAPAPTHTNAALACGLFRLGPFERLATLLREPAATRWRPKGAAGARGRERERGAALSSIEARCVVVSAVGQVSAPAEGT